MFRWIIGLFVLVLAGCSAPSPPKAEETFLKLIEDTGGTVPKRVRGFEFLGSQADPQGWQYNFKAPTGKVRTVLLRRSIPDKPAFSRTACGDLMFIGHASGDEARRLTLLMGELTRRVQRNCTKSVLAAVNAFRDSSSQTDPLAKKLADHKDVYPVLPGATISVWTAYALLFLWLAAIAALIRLFILDFGGPQKRYGLWLIGIVLAGMVVRLLFHHQMVMYYMGYRLVDYAANPYLVPKYGPGAFVFYHLLIQVFGVTHRVIQYTNSVIGPLTILGWGLVIVEMGGPRLGAVILALVLSFSPVFILDHNSESILVPTVMWFVTGSAGVLAFLNGKGRVYLVAGLAGLALAGYSRPEVLIVVFLSLPVWVYAATGKVDKASVKLTVLLSIVLAVVFLPRLYHLLHCLPVEKARHNAPYTGHTPGLDVLLVKI